MIEIQGSRLKLNADQPDEGIFLINTANNSEIKVEQVHTNLPSKLAGMLPNALAAGTYILEVRNRQNGNKNLSAGMFTAELSVN